MSAAKSLRPAEIVSLERLTPSVSSYRFRLLDGKPFGWAPGQYVELFSPNSPQEPLPYSIASAPDPARENEFELAIGPGSGRDLLSGVGPGSRLQVAGPFGELLWPPSGGTALMIGTGTGVAPLRALLQATLRGSEAYDLILLSGHRSEEDILWGAELAALSRESGRFQYEVTLTQPSDAWTGRRGRVQEHTLDLRARLHEPTVFLCGGLTMVNECRRLLEEQGQIPSRRIFAEGY